MVDTGPAVGNDHELLKQIISTSPVTQNLAQQFHVTTRDKVELALRRKLPRYTSTEQVVAAFGVLLAVGTSILTADFRSALGIDGKTWLGVFAVAAVLSFVWFVYETVRWFGRPRLTDLVDEVLRSSDRLAP